MRRALIDSENSLWRNVLGVIAAAIIIPIAIILALVAKLFARPRQSTAEEVARDLRAFLAGTGNDGDWDAFTHIPISDSRLESIRQRAAELALPLTERGERVLVRLLAEAEALARAAEAPSENG
jgi:hypothetical protein